MWGRLSGVASNVAGYVVQGNEHDDQLRQQLEDTQEELETALSLIEQRDREILNLSTAVSATPQCEETSDDLENIRQKLAQFRFDDPDQIEDVISDISFSLSEKSSTISQLQSVIDSLREKQQNCDTELPPNSPGCDDFYESQISRLTELCTSLRNKEKNSVTEIERLKCELTDAKAEIQHLQRAQHSSSPDNEEDDPILRLEEENRLLLAKVASEAAHKDILRDQLDELRDNQQEKHHFLESIQELQDALQQRTAEFSSEKQKNDDLASECDNLQNQLTEVLSEKQKKIQKNLFEVKEEETEQEELDRLKVENSMLISKISDLMADRDKAREEIEALQERHGTSRDALIKELQEKEHELEDSMTIVSLLQEQIKSGHDSLRVSALLEEIKDKNTLIPKVESLEKELNEAKKQLEDYRSQEKPEEDEEEVFEGECRREVEEELRLAQERLVEWQLTCSRTIAVWRTLISEEKAGRTLSSVTEEGASGEQPSHGEATEHSELHELITTAELLTDQYRVRSSTPPEVDHLQAEVERLSDCLRAREELISGLREDINQRQEKESSYREKVAELYSQIENSQIDSVKDVIDFSDSFVSGLEEQLSVAQKILKIKEEEICGLNKMVRELRSRPNTPTSPAPRFDSYLENSVKELNQKICDLNKQLVDEREESISLQMTVDDQNTQISALQREISDKVEDISRIEKEYEAEMMNMSSNYKDQKAMNYEELGNLSDNVEDLRTRIKESEKENNRLKEMYDRVKEEHTALLSEMENNDDERVSPVQSKYNLKEQHLNDALNEIDNLREALEDKSDSLTKLETDLTSQRGVNVHLQDTLNELKDRCDVLECKEAEYLQEIEQLSVSVSHYEVSYGTLQSTLTSTEKELDTFRKEKLVRDSEVQHSIRELKSALQELKLSKEALKSDVQTDLDAISQQWTSCVDEIKQYTSQLPSNSLTSEIETKVSGVLSEIKSLHTDYLGIKTDVESLLTGNVHEMFPEIKSELEKIIKITAEKDGQIVALEGEVQKYKAAGKKIIDKLKKHLKDKDMMIKKIASETGDDAVLALQEANSSLNKQISELEHDNEYLSTEIADLKGTAVCYEKEISELKETSFCYEKELSELKDISMSYQESQNKDQDILRETKSDIENFIIKYQEIYHCQLLDNSFDLLQFNTVGCKMINLAQADKQLISDQEYELKESNSNLDSLSEKIDNLESEKCSLYSEIKELEEVKSSLEKEVDIAHTDNSNLKLESDNLVEENSSLKEDVGKLAETEHNLIKLERQNGDLLIDLKTKSQENEDLLKEIELLRADLQATHQDSNRMVTQQNELQVLEDKNEELNDNNEALMWKISELTDESIDKSGELKTLSEELKTLTNATESLKEQCSEKDEALQEMKMKCEDLECTVDTLSSQVSCLAEEKDVLETSIREKEVDTSIGEEVDELKEALKTKINECKKFVAVIKKLKMIKEESDKKIAGLQDQLKLLEVEKVEPAPSQILECVELTSEALPVITEAKQGTVHAEMLESDVHEERDDKHVITPANTSSLVPLVTESRDSGVQSEDTYSVQEDTINSLQDELVQLYNDLRFFEESCSDKDELISSLSDQLSISKQLLSDTRQECQAKLDELQKHHDDYQDQLNQMQKEKEEWVVKRKELEARSALTEAEAVRQMSGRPPVQELDTVSEVSHASIMSHDTSYLSMSSYNKEMPNDVETLQAELMKKNKLAFLIKTKAKKLESRVRDAKREADKSKAHDRVKDKIQAIETELTSITAQLRNLSTGKKIEPQTTRIDPKYVEEMENRLTHLTQVEQKYENLMEELQLQLHAKGVAEDRLDQLNHTVNDLEDRLELLQSDVRDKDTLLCEHIDAAADDSERMAAIKEKFEQQGSELLHLRELNKKMKAALIEVTDESARIEQTYKSTMHELEEESDKLKCDNATLSNELTNCWAKIEDLEEQNQNYMTLLESAHQQLRQQTTVDPGLQSQNTDLLEKLGFLEQEKCNFVTQLHELTQLYNECLESKTALSAEKDKLQSIVCELESRIADQIKSTEDVSSELDLLKGTNSDLSAQLDVANQSLSKLKRLQEEYASVSNQLEESQYNSESLQRQLNIMTEEKNQAESHVDKCYNQLNDLLSTHESCGSSISDLKSQCASLQSELIESNEALKSLKQDYDVMSESQYVSVQEKDEEIKQLSEQCLGQTQLEEQLLIFKQENEDLSSEVDSVRSQLDEKVAVELSLKEKLDVIENEICGTKSKVAEYETTIENLKNSVITSSEELDRIQTEKDQAIENLLSARGDLGYTLKEKEDSEEKLEQVKKVNQEYIEQLHDLETSLEEKQVEISELVAALGSAKVASLSATETAQQLEELKICLENVSQEKQSLEQHMSGLTEEKEALVGKNEASADELEQVKKANEEYLEQLHDASYKLEQWAQYNENVVNDLQQVVNDLQQQIVTCNEELRQTEQVSSDMTSQVESLSSSLTEVGSDLDKATKLVGEKESLITSLESEVTEYKSKIDEIILEKDTLVSQLEETVSYQQSVLEDHDLLKSKFESLSEDNNDLQEKLSELNADVTLMKDEKAREIDKLNSKLEDFDGVSKQEMDQKDRELEEKNVLLEGMEEKLRAAEIQIAENAQSLGQLKELSAKESQLTEKIDSLELQLQDAYDGNEEAINILNTELQSLKDTNSLLSEEQKTVSEEQLALTETCELLEQQLAEAGVKVGQYEGMLGDWTSYGEQREAYVSQLQSSLEEFQTQLQQLQEQSRGLGEELEQSKLALKKATEDKETISKKAKGVMKAYKDSKIQLEMLKKESGDKESEEAESLKAQLSELTISRATLSESVSRLETENKDLMSEVEQFEVEREFMTTLKDENKVLKQDVLEKSRTIDEQAREIDEWSTTHLNNTQAWEQDLLSFKEEKNSAQTKMSECIQKIKLVEKENSDKDLVISDLQNEIDILTNNLSSLAEENNAKNLEISHFKESVQMIDEYTNIINKLKEENSSQENEIIDLKGFQTGLARTFEDLELDFENASDVLTRLVVDLKDANMVTLSLSDFFAALESGNLISFVGVSGKDKLSAIMNRITELAGNVITSDSELRSLKLQIDDLKNENNVLKSTSVSLVEANNSSAELRRKVEFLERDRSEHEHTVELLHQKFEENYHELASVKSVLENKEKELLDVTNQFQSTITKLAEKEVMIRNLDSSLSERDQEKNHIRQNFEEQIKDFYGRNTELQRELTQLTQDIALHQTDNQDLQNEVRNKEEKIAAVLGELDDSKSQVSELISKQSLLQQQYDQVLSQLQLNESEVESITEQLNVREMTIHSLQGELTSFRRQLEAANSSERDEELLNAIRQKDDTIEELRGQLDILMSDLRASMENSQHQTEEFDAERSALNSEMKLLQNTLESVRSEVIIKNQKIEDLDEQCRSLLEQSESLSSTNTSLQQEIAEIGKRFAETNQLLEKVTAQKAEIENELSLLNQEKSDLELECSSLSSWVDNLQVEKETLQKSSDNSADIENLNTKVSSLENSKSSLENAVSSLQQINKTLEQNILRAEEEIGEVTANYEQKCMEVTSLDRELSSKNQTVETLREKLKFSEIALSEKCDAISKLEADFKDLVSMNSKLQEFTSELEDAKKVSAEATKLKIDLDQALVDNKLLQENNTMLVGNNTQLSDNYKQLHDSVLVFQQRDVQLNDMISKLQDHAKTLERHVKTITDEFNVKFAEIVSEKEQLAEELESTKSGEIVTPQVNSLQDEIGHLNKSKDKLVSEVDGYQNRLKIATNKAENLEKSLQEMTSRFNEKCGVVEKKTADLNKLAKQYKIIKQKLVNELNTRKSLVQETINGKEKVAIQFGEKSKRLKELQSQLYSSQRDRETLTSAVEGVVDCITGIKGKLVSKPTQPESLSDSLSVLIDGLEFKTKDILTFLSRPLPSLSRIDLSSYRDSDLWSDYSRGADSIVFSDISDVGPGSIRSELSLNFSEITNNNYQTVPVIRDRKGSGTSSVTSERLRASAEINRSSTGVLNRLAYNLIGDSRGRTPSGSTTGTT